MKRFVAVLLLSLFVYDIAIDAFDTDCQQESVACHTCVCTHAVQPRTGTGANTAALTPQRIPGRDLLFLQRLSDKSLFHPPKTLA